MVIFGAIPRFVRFGIFIFRNSRPWCCQHWIAHHKPAQAPWPFQVGWVECVRVVVCIENLLNECVWWWRRRTAHFFLFFWVVRVCECAERTHNAISQRQPPTPPPPPSPPTTAAGSKKFYLGGSAKVNQRRTEENKYNNRNFDRGKQCKNWLNTAELPEE